jgi:Cof subfamily protein (haloacid dehalogenase superfamily)
MLLTKNEIKQKLIINHNQVKTFVFDLDGTLIYDGLPLEARFEKVLRRIKAAGHHVMFATGRSWRDFVPVVPAWCSEQPSVLFGGGLVLHGGEIYSQHFLPSNDVEELVSDMDTKQLKYLIDGHSSYYHPSQEHWIYEDIVKISGQSRDLHVDNIVRDGAYKILVLEDAWLDYFHQVINERDLIIKHHSYDRCFDIMPARVNKYVGLRELNLPAPENIYVFGNDGNDLELMQNLPNSVLFGNHAELTKYAKVRINYDDDLFANFESVVNTILEK